MSAARDPFLLWKIAGARLFQMVGVAGIAGIALVLAAAAALGVHALNRDSPVAAEPLALPPAAPVAVRRLVLPPASEIPLLLTQLEQAATAQGLGWPQAQYRLVPAGENLPASLELRLAFKAPYLAVRRFAAAVLSDVPGATLREFAISRPNSDAAQVEAKIALTIFLAGDAGATARAEAAR